VGLAHTLGTRLGTRMRAHPTRRIQHRELCMVNQLICNNSKSVMKKSILGDGKC
jgi:hypothetical protein